MDHTDQENSDARNTPEQSSAAVVHSLSRPLRTCHYQQPNDLSSFAMPLLESDIQDGLTIDNEPYRARSGSGSGIKNFIKFGRSRNKSGEVAGTDSKNGSKSNSPTSAQGPSRVRTFLDAFRPRSKSDVSTMSRPRKSPAQPAKITERRRRSSSSEEPAHLLLSKSPPPAPTPMSMILADGVGDDKSNRNHAPLMMEKFRSRAYSDPKPPRQPRYGAFSPPLSPHSPLSPPMFVYPGKGVKLVDGRMSRSLVENSSNDHQHYIIYRDRSSKFAREFGKVPPSPLIKSDSCGSSPAYRIPNSPKFVYKVRLVLAAGEGLEWKG